MSQVIGYESLRRRFQALGAGGSSRLMAQFGTAVVAEAHARVPQKTRNLYRSIHVASSTPTSVTVLAGANYAAYVEFGTRPHEIRPTKKAVLAWQTTAAGRRLTGTARSSTRRAGATGWAYAMVVHHPGTRPEPYLIPGAKAAVSQIGTNVIVKIWDEAK